MELLLKAKEAEKESNWKEAERLWLLQDSKSNAEACKMIYKAIERGNHYRKRVLYEAGPEPDKCENPRAWIRWYDHMNQIYKEVYYEH